MPNVIITNPEQVEQDEIDKIHRAVREARIMAKSVKAEMEVIWSQQGGVRTRRSRRRVAWSRNVQFVRHFGDGTHLPFMRRLRRRIRRIEYWLVQGPIYFTKKDRSAGRCLAGSGGISGAYVITVIRDNRGRIRAPRIYLCPKFFREEPAMRARTIIHEVAHEMGAFRDGDVVESNFGGQPVYTAENHPRRALRTAQNYEGLYDGYYPTPD